MSTVILGGGIIGLSTAYYLSLNQQSSESSTPSIHIIDSSPALLASASGFAGGFLALDWFRPEVASLGALSFRLHRQLAAKHNGQRRWGYAGSHVYSLSVDERSVSKREKTALASNWLLEGTSRAETAGLNTAKDSNGTGNDRAEERFNDDGTPVCFTPQRGGTVETISGPEECAQIEPRELCEFLLAECKARGVRVHLSTQASEVLQDEAGTMKALRLRSEDQSFDLECSNLVLTAGAWTPRVFKTLFPQSKLRVPIDPLAGHSITVRSPRYKIPFLNTSSRKLAAGDDEQMCYAIYAPPGPRWSYATEAFARLARQGQTEIWLGGLNDSALPLPELAVQVKEMVDRESVADLRRTIVQLTGLASKQGEGEGLNHDDLETVRESLCFRPVSRSGKPIIAPVPEGNLGGVKLGRESEVWIASGHGPWGITLSLGSGLVLSEMLQSKKTSADVSGLGLS